LPVRDRFASETFAIVFGDNINDLDLSDMLAAHRESGALASVAVYEREDVTQSGVAEIGGAGRIVGFLEKPAPGEAESHWVNAGVVIAEPAMLDLVRPPGPVDLGRDVLPVLAGRRDGLHAYRMRGEHWWFDRADEYRTASSDQRLIDLARRLPPVQAGSFDTEGNDRQA
jgi:NDP-sugar pyrophosphorylase family protein